MKFRKPLLLAIILAAIAIALPSFTHNQQLHAQDDDSCTPFLDEALQVVGSACAEMGRNEACYGHYPITVELQPDITAQFESDGDLIGIVDLESLVTNPADPETGAWGIALMLVQADLPADTEATMTFVLFGDVEIASAVEPQPDRPTCAVSNTGSNNINIRASASTNGDIVGTFTAGETATATGRNETADWLRIQQNDTTGWVFSDLVALDCDAQTLAVTNDLNRPITAPMQAITLTSGQNETCQSAPDGLLIRSPEGRRARVVVNGVEMVFSSAGFLTAQANNDMTIQGLEGEIDVTSDGVTQTILPDMFTTVPLDSNLAPAGPPDTPQSVPSSPITTTLNTSLDMLYTNDIGIETCTGTANSDINTRTGPGTDFPQSVDMPEGQERAILGTATGTDGRLWWKFGLTWVRSDLVTTVGDCSRVPEITDIVHPPTPVPTSAPAGGTSGGGSSNNGGGSVTVHVLYPSGCSPSTVNSTDVITIMYGTGFESPEARDAGYSEPHGIYVNDVSIEPLQRVSSFVADNPPYAQYSIDISAVVGTLEPGSYEISVIDHFEPRGCTLIVN